MTTFQNNKVIKEVESLEARSIFHCETNQCCDFPTWAFKFYENPSYVSFLLVGTLPHVYHSKKNSWSPSTYVDDEHEYEVEDILDSKIFNHQFEYLVHWHRYDVGEHIWELIKNLLKVIGFH
jgi:hypothetical protein